MKNPPSKSLIAYRKMKAAPAREPLRLQGIKALGISLANSRTDIDPSQYSFTHRGFIGSANDHAPRSRDLDVFFRTYPDYTWDEAQAFSRAHSHIMYLRVKDAMDRAHGEGWADRAYRNNPASYRTAAPAARSFNARHQHPYWALSRWVSSDMEDHAAARQLEAAIGKKLVDAARTGVIGEQDLEEVVLRKYGSPAPLSNPANPYDWRQEESRKAVLKALQTRDPEDMKKARALQARNEMRHLEQRKNPAGLIRWERVGDGYAGYVDGGAAFVITPSGARGYQAFEHQYTREGRRTGSTPVSAAGVSLAVAKAGAERAERALLNPLGSRIAVPIGSGLIVGDQLVNPRRKRAPGQPSRKPFQAQAFLFDRNHWTEARARQWLKKNGHKIGEVTTSDEYLHFKHWSPFDYQKGTLHNVQIAPNVMATVGVPTSHSDAINAPGYNKRGPRQGRLFTRTSEEYVFAGDPDDILW